MKKKKVDFAQKYFCKWLEFIIADQVKVGWRWSTEWLVLWRIVGESRAAKNSQSFIGQCQTNGRGPLREVRGEGGMKIRILMWLFHVLRSRPCPCRYLTHLYVVCGHFILSCLRRCSRATLFVRFYPNRASVMKTPFPTINCYSSSQL